LLFSGAAFGLRTASFANPADTEFLYFIQRSDRISTDDPVGTRPGSFNFRNGVLPVRFRPARLPARLRRDIAHADTAEAI